MNIYDAKVTRNFLRQVIVIAIEAAREFPKKRKGRIADALLDTLEEMPMIETGKGHYRLGAKKEAAK